MQQQQGIDNKAAAGRAEPVDRNPTASASSWPITSEAPLRDSPALGSGLGNTLCVKRDPVIFQIMELRPKRRGCVGDHIELVKERGLLPSCLKSRVLTSLHSSAHPFSTNVTCVSLPTKARCCAKRGAEARVSSEPRKMGECRVSAGPALSPPLSCFLQTQAVPGPQAHPSWALSPALLQLGPWPGAPALPVPSRSPATLSPQLSAGSRAGPGREGPKIRTLRAEHLPLPPSGLWALPALPTAHLSHRSARAAGAWYRSPWQPCICRSGF